MNNRNQDDSETEVKKVDRFGFVVKASENKQELAKRSTLKRDNARIEKWRAMLPKLESMIAKRDKKLKKRIRKGIPDSFRTKVWPMLARIEEKKNNSHIEYKTLLTMNTTYIEDIQKDVYRTFPNHPFFAVRDGPGQKGLENVLKALSITYKEMGYCQGLNFVCALLVLYCNDEEAYWMMNALISTYNLEDYYRDLNYVKKPLFVLDELIKAHFPKVGKQMAKFRIEGLFYATGWIMTLYSNFLPFNLVVRLFDCFLFEEFKILYRIGLAIIKIKKKKILKCTSMEQILGHLKNFEEPEFHNDDQFLKIAFGISLSRKEIQKIQLRYRPK